MSLIFVLGHGLLLLPVKYPMSGLWVTVVAPGSLFGVMLMTLHRLLRFVWFLIPRTTLGCISIVMLWTERNDRSMYFIFTAYFYSYWLSYIDFFSRIASANTWVVIESCFHYTSFVHLYQFIFFDYNLVPFKRQLVIAYMVPCTKPGASIYIPCLYLN